jgi:hypothetical protein
MSLKESPGERLLIAITLLAAAALAVSGCADYAAVGVGYSDAYYVPDYHPFYGAYFYDGYPWWGGGPYVINKYVVKDVDRRTNVNRNIYYGGHHFVGNAGARGRAVRPSRGHFNLGARSRHHT